MTDDGPSPARSLTGPVPTPAGVHALTRLERQVCAARMVIDAEVLGGSGVTWCGYLLLSAVARRDRMELRELADQAKIAPGTVTNLVGMLHRAGWLRRSTESASGGGRVLVALTPAGRGKLEALHATIEPLARTLLAGIRELLDTDTTPPTGRPPSDVDNDVRVASPLPPWQLARVRELLPPVTPSNGHEPGE
jgi:DNA-binding MarR family transcriptional regulator